MRAPVLAVGDGAGFWNALNEVSPATGHQRSRVHKTANGARFERGALVDRPKGDTA